MLINLRTTFQAQPAGKHPQKLMSYAVDLINMSLQRMPQQQTQSLIRAAIQQYYSKHPHAASVSSHTADNFPLFTKISIQRCI